MYAGIFMLIFAICVFLVGLYAYTGHKIKALAWKAAFKNLTILEWKNVGKWTMISGLWIAIIGILLILIDL